MANNLPDGIAFVAGRGRDKAIALLAAADRAGVDQTLVRTVSDGFTVPVAVADEYEKALADAEKSSTPKASAEKKIPAKGRTRKTTKSADADPIN